MKEIVAMLCITVIGVVQLVLYGDSGVLTACVTAITALAGVSLGAAVAKREG